MSEQTNAVTTEPKKLDMDELKKSHYFAPTDLQNGLSHLEVVMGSAANTPLYFNFDEKAEISPPEGFGLLIRPLTAKNNEKGKPRVLEGIIAGFVPDFATVIKNDKGANLLKRIWEEAVGRRLTGIVSLALAAHEKPILPVDLEGFTERASRGEGLEAFNHKDIGPKAVNTLKKQGLLNMDKNVLRAVLMSAAYAKQNFPKLAQSIWVAIGRQMQKDAQALGLNASIYDTWLENRETMNFGEVESIDLSAFGIAAEATE